MHLTIAVGRCRYGYTGKASIIAHFGTECTGLDAPGKLDCDCHVHFIQSKIVWILSPIHLRAGREHFNTIRTYLGENSICSKNAYPAHICINIIPKDVSNISKGRDMSVDSSAVVA